MKTTRTALILLAALATVPATAQELADNRQPSPSSTLTGGTARTVELAICLDTSGSMSGLINSARQKLWAIVNDLALAEPTPRLRVALLTFGSPAYGAEGGFVRLQVPLTEDLDQISNELFALTTNGGTEYVGRVMQNAVRQLGWTEKDALKIIVVAGNESAEQDPNVPLQVICKEAIENDIIVNSIYCGNPADDIAPGWQQVARLADGRFASIDQDQGTLVVTTPFDDQLAKLSGEINTTYLAFGAQGEEASANQVAQDFNASGLNSAASAARAQTKASKLYFCAWDLVDATGRGDIKLEEVEEDKLPEELRGLSLEEKQKVLADAGRKRADLQKQVTELSEKRNQYIQDEMKKQAKNDDQAFDQVIRNTIREQAEVKGLKFKKSEAPKAEDGNE